MLPLTGSRNTLVQNYTPHSISVGYYGYEESQFMWLKHYPYVTFSESRSTSCYIDYGLMLSDTIPVLYGVEIIFSISGLENISLIQRGQEKDSILNQTATWISFPEDFITINRAYNYPTETPTPFSGFISDEKANWTNFARINHQDYAVRGSSTLEFYANYSQALNYYSGTLQNISEGLYTMTSIRQVMFRVDLFWEHKASGIIPVTNNRIVMYLGDGKDIFGNETFTEVNNIKLQPLEITEITNMLFSN